MATSTEVVVQGLCSMVGSRHEAADVLRKVADAASWGGFPSDVTCEQVGQALERICLNAPVANPLTRVLRGWRKATRRRDRAHESVPWDKMSDGMESHAAMPDRFDHWPAAGSPRTNNRRVSG